MQLSIDHRETRLSDALLDIPHRMIDMPVGDIRCEYSDDRTAWVAERKTSHDLAASIKSGRWADQNARLHESGYVRIFFIIEGDLRSPQFPYESLLGCVLNAELRPRSHVIRSIDINETAAIVSALCKKAGCSAPGIPSGLAPPVTPTSKRKRDSDTVTVRMLMCVPSISENIAKALLGHFGTLPALIGALNFPRSFPRVQLNDRTCLGKKRIKLLATHFCTADTD